MDDSQDRFADSQRAVPTGPSRRAFLTGAAGLTGVAIASGAWGSPAFAADTSVGLASPMDPGFPSRIFADLTLDGAAAGLPFSTDGGQATSDVVTEKIGGDHIIHKHLAGVKYEDITVTVGSGMSKQFYDWVKDSFDKKFSHHDGTIRTFDFTRTVLSELAFTSGLISEIDLPALDAASKDAAKMTIKFSPELTRYQLGSGRASVNPKVQKAWLPSNFRLKIDGLDATRVNKIDAITIKQVNATKSPDGGVPEPTHLEIPNLAFTLSESSSASWYQWLDDFVIKGNNGQDQERQGQLAYMAVDGSALFTLDLHQLGIFKLTPEKVEAGSENVRRVKAELYCEEIKFSHFLQ